MTQNYKTATVFGATGFVGRQVVRELAARGIVVKVATRVPERAYFLKPCGAVGQVVPWACDYNDSGSIDRAVVGSDIVVNCIGILYEKGRSTFQKTHVDIPAAIAQACAKHNIKRFVHISSLSAGLCSSKYATSKQAGDEAVHKYTPKATILRPSVIFGEDDSFFNMFASLMSFVPALPLIGGGKTRLQPVFVGDVADAVMVAIERDVSGDNDPRGKIYALGGPDVVTFKKIYELIFEYTGHTRPLVNLPFFVAKIEACFLSLLPKPLLTPDQVESLKSDNVVPDGALGLDDLGITPTAMQLILPTYLKRYRKGGRFSQKAA